MSKLAAQSNQFDENSISSHEREYHHTGDLEVDYEGDFWADHDEDCHGKIDTNSMRREYPEGFKWTCCEKTGDESGCTLGKGSTIDELYPDSPKPKLKSKIWFHPGDLEVDYDGDVWADHDEDCHGEIDTNTNRREIPEGFKWTCCSKIGTYAKGCEKRIQNGKIIRKKKNKYFC